MTELFDRHRDLLERAIEATRVRAAWTPFVESPSRRNHPEGAHDEGIAEFEALLKTSFPLDGRWSESRVGEEISPYTRRPLAIDYPRVDRPDALFEAATAGLEEWIGTGVKGRVGVCLELLDRLHRNTFANAYATMHTAGQSFMMAFAGSGANSLDRGLEALAYAYRAMDDVPPTATFERSFGGDPVRLQKTYRLRPRGVALVITCASYPAWNAYPAIFANLATGNPVIVKPHPGGTLPMAMAVRIGRQVLDEQGFDPNLLTLAPDTSAEPITKSLALHPQTRIVDFTGSQAFGAWLEENCRGALVFTETAGTNAVVLESTADLGRTLRAVALGVCLFSSQMCTAPQNLFVPKSGVDTDEGRLGHDEVEARLVAAIDDLAGSEQRAAAVCGAIQSDAVLRTIDRARESAADLLRDSTSYAHPEFGRARTATPIVLREPQPHSLARREWFGPVAFVLPVEDREAALGLAARDAAECGAIASYLYSTDPDFVASAEESFARAGASLGINLVGQRPINFTAGYSDYHVTGLNPAGNACLTDLAFVANRFRVVQTKIEV